MNNPSHSRFHSHSLSQRVLKPSASLSDLKVKSINWPIIYWAIRLLAAEVEEEIIDWQINCWRYLSAWQRLKPTAKSWRMKAMAIRRHLRRPLAPFDLGEAMAI